MEGLERAVDESLEEDSDVFLQDDPSPTIREHAARCHSLFRKYVAMPEILPDPTVMDDQLARFSLWASNMNVFGPLNVSLDYRLRFSPIAADIIHQLLDIICDTLRSLKPIDGRPPQSPGRKRQRLSVRGDSGLTRRSDDDDARDSENDVDSAKGNISKITETVGGTLTRLLRLSNAVRKSAKANRARKIDRYRDDEEANKDIDELRLYTQCYIKFRFPEVPEALLSALVEANALRLRRLYYQHSHRRRIDLSTQSPDTTPASVRPPRITENAPTVRFEPSALPQPATTNEIPAHWTAPAPAPATNATTAQETSAAALYTMSTTEVPRAQSVLVNSKLAFPPIPPTPQCPYCGVVIEFRNRSSLWQKHVIEDLEPFVCVFSNCLEAGHHGYGTGPLTFETSEAWSSHMQTPHGQTWECRAPSHDPIVFDQEIHYQEHSIKEHGVPEAYVGTLSNAARRSVLEKVLECPFGDEFQPSEEMKYSAVFSSEALQSHIASHMKEIALLTLQKFSNDDDENTENVDSGVLLEDDGRAGDLGFTRASMVSVLADEDLRFLDGDADVADGNVAQREDGTSARVGVIDPEDKDNIGLTNLHRAVQAGDLGLVFSLVQSGASVNSRDENGQTPLHHAAEKGFTECLEVLINHGGNLHTTDNSGFPPFLWAVVAGQEGAAKKLLSMDAVAHSFSAGGKSALGWAASMGWSLTAKMLVEHDPSILGTQNTEQTRPLAEAAASGNLSAVLMLLERGAEPDQRDRDGWSAIHWAAEEGYLDIVLFLLKAGGDSNAISSYGTSPLHCAANGGHVSIVSLLLEEGADPLMLTCHGWSALHHAAYMGHSHVVQGLLEDERVQSNASHQDEHGWSVLHLAVYSRDLATVRILLDKSGIAEPQTLRDKSGLTAEDWLNLGSKNLSQEATGKFAFSKSRCCRAVTSFRQAVTIGNVAMIKLLFRLGHDINGMNSGRRTALYYAAKNSMISIIDLLLELGADPNILPAGRRSWEDFIPPGDVLSRLHQAGYRLKRYEVSEVERQISEALRAQSQPSGPELRARSKPASPELALSKSALLGREMVPDLGEQIRQNFVHSSYLTFYHSDPDTTFMPEGKLEDLFTADAVKKALGKHFSNKTYDFIRRKASKVFATLVFINNAEAIKDFEKFGVSDNYLPIVLEADESRPNVFHLVSERDENSSECDDALAQLLVAQNDWSMTDWAIKTFCDSQWTFMAPVLSDTSQHCRFSARRVLPFYIPAGENPVSKPSTFSTVYQAWVHPSNQKFKDLGFPRELGGPVAVKKLNVNVSVVNNYDVKTAYYNEIESLKIFNGVSSTHLIKTLCTFQHGVNGYYIMFPWATANLREYWEDNHPGDSDGGGPSAANLKWMFEQLAGLSGAIHSLHFLKDSRHLSLSVAENKEMNCRHGDLKPDNILLMGPGKGRLVIADVGLAKVHGEPTRYRKDDTRSITGTERYEPPDIIHGGARSRAYDIWSFGCICLEFIVWILYGKFGLRNLRQQILGRHKFWFSPDAEQTLEAIQSEANSETSRMEPGELDKLKRRALASCTINENIQALLEEMRRTDPRCSNDSPIKDLLDLAESRLLMITINRGNNPLKPNECRAGAKEMSRAIKAIHGRAVKDKKYLDTCLKSFPMPRITPKPPKPQAPPRSGDFLGDELRAAPDHASASQRAEDAPTNIIITREGPQEVTKDSLQRNANAKE